MKGGLFPLYPGKNRTKPGSQIHLLLQIQVVIWSPGAQGLATAADRWDLGPDLRGDGGGPAMMLDERP